jgi:hypothetical protein
MTHDIHDTVRLTRASASTTPSHPSRRGRHAVRGDLGVAWRRTANGTREQAEHAHLRDRRSRPERHPWRERAHGPGVPRALLQNEGAGEREQDEHSMQQETEYVNGITIEATGGAAESRAEYHRAERSRAEPQRAEQSRERASRVPESPTSRAEQPSPTSRVLPAESYQPSPTSRVLPADQPNYQPNRPAEPNRRGQQMSRSEQGGACEHGGACSRAQRASKGARAKRGGARSATQVPLHVASLVFCTRLRGRVSGDFRGIR